MLNEESMSKERYKIKDAWNSFVNIGEIKSNYIRKEILNSWQRCQNLGLDPYRQIITPNFSESQKRQAAEKSRVLTETARPFLQGLFDLLKGMEMVVFLTNDNCYILEAFGEGHIWEYCRSKNAVVGSSFHKKYSGTNAVNMAIELDQPYQMSAEEHYIQCIHKATCAAAPIHEASGKIIGCLDITASYETALKHPHTLGMIVASAQVIENQLSLKRELEKSFLTEQYLKAAMESMVTGLIVLNQNNEVTHINPSAEKLLSVNADRSLNRNIVSLIRNQTILNAIDKNGEFQDEELIVESPGGKLRCMASIQSIYDLSGQRIGAVLCLKEMKMVQKLAQKAVGFHATFNFSDIRWKSKKMGQCVNLSQNAARGDSNVLISGESGTGKEMIAQSIHNASAFSDGPFLGINCAAIPNDLIESELFGYESGTFTGGLKSGKPGKLEIANGGTLFLDDVNAMSMHMQVKLLRLLEEKKFQRLGGRAYIDLEARIVAATNKNLQEELLRGTFRSDLYYRLNVLEVHVPPLRERLDDIKLLAQFFIQDISRKLGKNVEGITPNALAHLERQYWPGNVRQLKNWIERAINFAEGTEIGFSDLPQMSGQEECSAVSVSADQKREPSFQFEEIERNFICNILYECDGNISKASRRMGIARSTMYRKIRRYDLKIYKNVAK